MGLAAAAAAAEKVAAIFYRFATTGMVTKPLVFLSKLADCYVNPCNHKSK